MRKMLLQKRHPKPPRATNKFALPVKRGGTGAQRQGEVSLAMMARLTSPSLARLAFSSPLRREG